MDLSILEHPTLPAESTEQLLAIVENMYAPEDPIITLLDDQFAGLSRMNQLHSLIKKHPEYYDSLCVLINQDELDLSVSEEGITAALQQFGSSLKTFGDKLITMIRNKTVTERYIYNRFNKLRDAIDKCENQRAMVSDVPTYDTVLKRLVGILQVSSFLEQLSKKSPDDQIFQDSLFDKVANLSNGVLKVSAPRKDAGPKGLVWNEPPLVEYDLISSPWKNNSNRERIRNTLIQCKYSGADAIVTATKSVVQAIKYMQNTDDVVTSNYYDENTQYTPSAQVAAHSTAYLIGKMCKQAYKNGIEREINTFCISYIHRLCSYKYI